MRSNRWLLWIGFAVAFTGGCLVDVPDTESGVFACSDNSDCLDGFVCGVEFTCIAASAPGGGDCLNGDPCPVDAPWCRPTTGECVDPCALFPCAGERICLFVPQATDGRECVDCGDPRVTCPPGEECVPAPPGPGVPNLCAPVCDNPDQLCSAPGLPQPAMCGYVNGISVCAPCPACPAGTCQVTPDATHYGEVTFCGGGGCPAPAIDCGGTCVDVSSDPNNCGDCGYRCNVNELCEAGWCQCNASTTPCPGVCADLTSDVNHCGSCNNPCRPGEACISSRCECPAGYVICADGCFDLSADPNHCGDCVNACSGTQICNAGACR